MSAAATATATTTRKTRPYRPPGKAFIGVHVDDSVLAQIDQRVTELQEQGLTVSRADVLRLLLTTALRLPRGKAAGR